VTRAATRDHVERPTRIVEAIENGDIPAAVAVVDQHLAGVADR
jgi:DNA-binding GntR family transcriptional regulator